MGLQTSKSTVQEYGPSKQINTCYGPIEGLRFIDENQMQVDGYLSVPYAKPPIGDLRFVKPRPPDQWKEVKKCIKFRARSLQKDFIWNTEMKKYYKSEDCLHLNVFAPVATKKFNNETFPVMVYIHGGGFSADSAINCGDIGICRNLCSKGVIVVTVQYRLGLLGFFSTGDSACPGNIGLWDQTLALKWVQENIPAFNGNPNQITVFGQSAGGACADLLSLSPHSRGLFQQVIVMAGNAECEWALSRVEDIRNFCMEFAKSVGWKPIDGSSNSSQEMLNYLREQPAKIFEQSLLPIDTGKSSFRLCLTPVIDGDFLPKSISDLRCEAPIKSCMAGICQYEAMLFLIMKPFRMNINGFNELIRRMISETEYDDWKNLREKAQKLYTNGEVRLNKLKLKEIYINLKSDIFVNNATYKYAKLNVEKGQPVYLYSFDYHNPKSLGPIRFTMPMNGATHCSELTYLFEKSIFKQFKFNQTDRRMMEVMGTFWTNFVKFGNPNGSQEQESEEILWKYADTENPYRYLNIKENSETKADFCGIRGKFWVNLEQKDQCQN